MANKIKTLPEKVINQIAAGEVVERPSSVVKELLENALDAMPSLRNRSKDAGTALDPLAHGAKAGESPFIEVEIQEGGSRLIKVTDNGEGMGPEDAKLAVQKHATSKIHSVDDLSHLHSFGFRGEALASIASVSHFELSTRLADALSGVSIKIKGGGTPKIEEAGRPTGTTVSVANLFFNTPARLKFMKKKGTEENHIVTVVTTSALAFPEVGFRLVMDGKETLHVTPSSFTQRLSQVLGKDISHSLQPVDFEGGRIRIRGAVSAPTITKPTRENLFFFVNHRWIMNPSLGHAVMTAYHTLLPTRRYPVAVLFLEVPEEEVDVNVHPTKREVKFAKDREVYEAIVRSIRSALLSSNEPLQPIASAPTPASTYSSSFEAPSLLKEPGTTFGATSGPTLYEKLAQKFPSSGTHPLSEAAVSSFVEQGFGKSSLQSTRIDAHVPLYNFSQLFNTFILFQSDNEMYIADQHTVHERLNYERFMKAVREKKLEVQPLLVPVTVELSAKEAQVLKNNMETLLELGMETAPFGGNTFLIRSVPADLAGKNIVALVKDLVDDLASQDASGVKSTNRLDAARERAATFMSCRSAVMAGDRLNEEQMRRLIDQMREANLPFTCPHGRPTIMSIPLSELYRRFDRH